MPTTFLKNPVSINVSSAAMSLSVSGVPADATSGAGVQPQTTLTVEGTTGQETTGTGQTAGTGADISIAAGTGGAAPAGSANGAGGSVTINPGSPGVGSGSTATHGNVLMATEGGKVGIGVLEPGSSLEVNGDVRATSLGVYMPPGAAGTFGIGGSVNPSVHLSSTAASSDVYLQNSSGRLDVLANNGTTANLSVTNAGKVGIGTTAPGQSLDVFSITASSPIHFRSNNVSAGGGYLTSTVGHNAMLSAGSELVGSGWVQRASSGQSSMINVGSSQVQFYTDNGATQGASLSPTKRAYFDLHGLVIGTTYTSGGVAPDNGMIVEGNIGVGTTAPGSRLHVNGGIQVGAPTGGDQGAGSINVSGDVYKNGAPMFVRLKEAQSLIAKLTKRVDRLEAQLRRTSAKPARRTKSGTSKPAKSGQSRKERR